MRSFSPCIFKLFVSQHQNCQTLTDLNVFCQRLCISRIKLTSHPSSVLLGSMVFLISHGTVSLAKPHSTQGHSGEDTVHMAWSFSRPGIDPTLCFTRFVLHPSTVLVNDEATILLANLAKAGPRNRVDIYSRRSGLAASRH